MIFAKALLEILILLNLGRCFEFSGFIPGTNQYSFTKVLCSAENHTPKNQTDFTESYGITQQTMNNYMRIADMILELEDLAEESNSFKKVVSVDLLINNSIEKY